MQRVIRDSNTLPGGTAALEAKVALIRRYFPPTIASLYALPREGSGGVIEWWTELGGQPTLHRDLNEDQQRQLLEKYHQRQHALGQLANELQARGEPGPAAELRTLINPPDLNHLYSLNGDPLVIRWHQQPPKPVAPVAPAVVPAVVPRSIWRWILPGLLPLLGLLFALWYWWGAHWWTQTHPVPVQSYACRDKTVAALPPEFVVVLDTSGSMNLNMAVSQEDEDWFFKEGVNTPADNPRRMKITASPTRLDIAKQSLAGVIGNLDPDIETRLITFEGCAAQPDHGVFNASARKQLIAGIQNLPADDGTPLAASLEKAASRVDGRQRDAVIMMFVDGEDGCGQNACSVSRYIASQQPRLRVNVVNISANTLSNCVAENTGGRVYASRDAVELAGMLEKATKEVSGTPDCP